MIKAINVGQQTLTPESPVLFGSNVLQYSNDVGHAASSGAFSLRRCGLYDVSFNGTISNPGDCSNFTALSGTGRGKYPRE